jgi:hypothetical protein
VMEQALADPSGYQSAHSDLSSADLMSIEDVNGDKKFTDADLQALLVNLRNGKGSAKTVPEPTTVMLLLLSLPAMLIARQRHAIAARQPNRKRKSLAN